MLIAEINQITKQVIAAAIEVHKFCGPGLLESAYEEFLCRELSLQKIQYGRQKPLIAQYKGAHISCGYRLDLLVDGLVVVELKSVETVLPVHKAQLLTYLRLGGYKIGLLINFNEALLKNGITRIANGDISN
jgi:GxxExxY protein